jgi:hypothetical protein
MTTLAEAQYLDAAVAPAAARLGPTLGTVEARHPLHASRTPTRSKASNLDGRQDHADQRALSRLLGAELFARRGSAMAE